MPRKLGEVSAHNAAQPATCGVAILVPLMVLYRSGRNQEEKTSRPGAAISILPLLENDDGRKFESSDATAIIVGEFAGAPVGAPLSLPAAAIIRQPLFNAA